MLFRQEIEARAVRARFGARAFALLPHCLVAVLPRKDPMHKVMSQIQLDANRRNAQKSTGPRTAPGKGRSARNNTRHGFFTRALILTSGPSAEDPAQWERFRDTFRTDFQPASHYERVLVDVLATCMWRARRVKRFEARLFADTTPAIEGNILDSLVRYENRLTRQFDRAWNLLHMCKKNDSFLSIQKRLEARAKKKNDNSNPSQCSPLKKGGRGVGHPYVPPCLGAYVPFVQNKK